MAINRQAFQVPGSKFQVGKKKPEVVCPFSQLHILLTNSAFIFG